MRKFNIKIAGMVYGIKFTVSSRRRKENGKTNGEVQCQTVTITRKWKHYSKVCITLPMAAGDDQGRIKFDGLSSSAGDYVPSDLAFTSRSTGPFLNLLDKNGSKIHQLI